MEVSGSQDLLADTTTKMSTPWLRMRLPTSRYLADDPTNAEEGFGCPRVKSRGRALGASARRCEVASGGCRRDRATAWSRRTLAASGGVRWIGFGIGCAYIMTSCRRSGRSPQFLRCCCSVGSRSKRRRRSHQAVTAIKRRRKPDRTARAPGSWSARVIRTAALLRSSRRRTTWNIPAPTRTANAPAALRRNIAPAAPSLCRA